MSKEDLLKYITEIGYNIGFGAKKHFATFDIINKIPGLISFSSLVFGIYALVIKSLSNEIISATFIILGVLGIYISIYNQNKNNYEEAGIKLTELFNDLKKIYLNVKNKDACDYDETILQIKEIENEYYKIGITNQIILSDWYAHYKFFWQFQIDWLDEQKQFKFLRDKIPLSFTIFLILLIVFILKLLGIIII